MVPVCLRAVQVMAFIIALASSIVAQHEGSYTRCKCPGQGMHFTEGVPLRLLADGRDINGWQWLEGQNESDSVCFYIDNMLRAADDHTRGYNHFESIVTGLSVGMHRITTRSLNFGNVVLASEETTTIVIDPRPQKAETLSLTTTIVLTGSQNLDWQNKIVLGNGYTVRSNENWSGRVIIKNSWISGLGVPGDSIPTKSNSVLGISLTTTGGSVTVENSIFEWTGGAAYTVDGAGTISIRNNEFRANAFIPYVSSNPDMSPFLQFKGTCTGTKVFQGNNVGAGFLYITNMKNWLIGGNTDAESNVFIGPRTGPRAEFCSNITLRGNYSRHDYYGGWSQGFNFWFYDTPGIIAEHNVIRQGSWPVQSISGTLRYNLLIECGHEWIRTAVTGTSIHHNIFVSPAIPGDPAGGIWLYGDQTDIAIYNNTFDAGNKPNWFPTPAVTISKGSMASSVRNNVFTGFSGNTGSAMIDRYVYEGESDSAPRLLYADYNCSYNPLRTSVRNYADSLISGKTKGAAGYGGHDLGGIDGKADPKFAQGIDIPYSINEGDLWNRVKKVSQVLAEYRSRYTPLSGSPLIDAGDPADGEGVDIGAVGAGKNDPNDLFGKFGSQSTTIQPNVVYGQKVGPTSVLSRLGNGVDLYTLSGRKIGGGRLLERLSGTKAILTNGKSVAPGMYLVAPVRQSGMRAYPIRLQ